MSGFTKQYFYEKGPRKRNIALSKRNTLAHSNKLAHNDTLARNDTSAQNVTLTVKNIVNEGLTDTVHKVL